MHDLLEHLLVQSQFSDEPLEACVLGFCGAWQVGGPAELQGPVNFGKNFEKKVRKHIDQVRNRGPVKDNIPSPGKGGIERIKEIITQRVAQGGGRATMYAGEPAIAFEDGGVTYIFHPNGDFWTILGN